MARLVHVIGASGRSGTALAQALGSSIVPIVRDAAKWRALGFGVPPRTADLTDWRGLTAVLRDATHIVSCAHARHAAQVIAAAPPGARLVFLGSTRKFTRWPDRHGNGVLAGEATFMASGRAGVMLHPTMIYGALGEDNVRRLAMLIRRLPVLPLPVLPLAVLPLAVSPLPVSPLAVSPLPVSPLPVSPLPVLPLAVSPLPGTGRSLVQPIHQSDVTRSILAALDHDWDGPNAIVIAGPDAVSYPDFVRAVAAAAGIPAPRVLRVPAGPLIAVAALTRFLPGLPTIAGSEIRRLGEDKNFDIAAMRDVLGVSPMSLDQGLALTFGPDHGSSPVSRTA